MLRRAVVLLGWTAASSCAAQADPNRASSVECLAYLKKYMPASDRASPNITADFLNQQVELALAARYATPWGPSVPKAIFLNDVLPYGIMSEPRGVPDNDWRPLFHQQLVSGAAAAPNMSAAAEYVNEACWALSEPPIKFVGSANCEVNSYAPFQTLGRHNSSCTGLALYVVAALRSVGIPARVAGTPHWNKCGGRGKACKACPGGDICTPGFGSSDDSCGNHDWAEAWADGEWHFMDPAGDPKLDHGWFVGNTKMQTEHVGSYYNHSVVASSWAPTAGLNGSLYPNSSPISHFPMVWAWADTEVNGWDVTGRYQVLKAAANRKLAGAADALGAGEPGSYIGERAR